MAPTIGQIASVSYPAVLNDMKKGTNQWSENAFMREFEKQGGIKKKSLGSTIDAPLDYRRNPGSEFLANDLQVVSLTKTEVVTTATYGIAELSIPVTWSKKDEVQNPSENQKIALVKTLLENGINSHDDMIEQALFAAAATNGFNSLVALLPTSGQGSVGAIDSATELWWRHPSNTYVDDTDIEASMTTTWNSAAKGSGSSLVPTIIVSDSATQAIFEGTQQPNQRFIDTDELKAGFKVLGFKTARYVFSQYATTSQLFLNPKSVQLIGSKEYFREKNDTQELQNAKGFGFKIYSALQLVINNKSRLGISHL
jgi:hypothetical protein